MPPALALALALAAQTAQSAPTAAPPRAQAEGPAARAERFEAEAKDPQHRVHIFGMRWGGTRESLAALARRRGFPSSGEVADFVCYDTGRMFRADRKTCYSFDAAGRLFGVAVHFKGCGEGCRAQLRTVLREKYRPLEKEGEFANDDGSVHIAARAVGKSAFHVAFKHPAEAARDELHRLANEI